LAVALLTTEGTMVEKKKKQLERETVPY